MAAALLEIQEAWKNYPVELPEDQLFLEKMQKAEEFLAWLDEGANPFLDMPFGILYVPPAEKALFPTTVYRNRDWPHNLSDYVNRDIEAAPEHANDSWRVLVAGIGTTAITNSLFRDIVSELPESYPAFLDLNHIDFLSLSRQEDRVIDETGNVALHNQANQLYARAYHHPGRYRYYVNPAEDYYGNDKIRPAVSM